MDWQKGKPSKNVEDRRNNRAEQSQAWDAAGPPSETGTRADKRVGKAVGRWRDSRSSGWRSIYYDDAQRKPR